MLFLLVLYIRLSFSKPGMSWVVVRQNRVHVAAQRSKRCTIQGASSLDPMICNESAPNSESDTAFAWNCWATTATLESVTFSKMAGPSTGPAHKQSAILLSRCV